MASINCRTQNLPRDKILYFLSLLIENLSLFFTRYILQQLFPEWLKERMRASKEFLIKNSIKTTRQSSNTFSVGSWIKLFRNPRIIKLFLLLLFLPRILYVKCYASSYTFKALFFVFFCKKKETYAGILCLDSACNCRKLLESTPQFFTNPHFFRFGVFVNGSWCNYLCRWTMERLLICLEANCLINSYHFRRLRKDNSRLDLPPSFSTPMQRVRVF